MNRKIFEVFFVTRRSPGSSTTTKMLEAEDDRHTKTVMTMADSVRPLLTSMKPFGQYFKCKTKAGDNTTNRKSRRWFMIYPLVVVILLWIHVARMFSVFKTSFSVYLQRLIIRHIISLVLTSLMYSVSRLIQTSTYV